MKAYSDIIQALHYMKRDLEVSLPAAYEHRDTDSPYYKAYDERYRLAWDDIRKYIDLGEFVISPTAVRLLRKLVSDSTVEDGLYVDVLEAMDVAVNACLPALKRVAQDDLGLRR